MTDGRAVVVDASTLVDLLAGTELAAAVQRRLAGVQMHAPAHLDAEVMSALGRLQRSGQLTIAVVSQGLDNLASAPIARQPLPELLAGAWARRTELRLTDALYVELAERLEHVLLTTDRRLVRAYAGAEAVVG